MFDRNAQTDRAVSPVIGVILMVAITVILAALIGTFVLGLGENVQQNVQAGVSIDHDGGNSMIRVTFASNQNADYLTVNSSATNSTGGDAGTYGFVLQNVSDMKTIDCSSNYDNDASGGTVALTVTGHMGDTSTVVQTKAFDEC